MQLCVLSRNSSVDLSLECYNEGRVIGGLESGYAPGLSFDPFLYVSL